jgi:hypothetical protein
MPSTFRHPCASPIHNALHFMTLFETYTHCRLKTPCAMPERRRREAMLGQSVARSLRKLLHVLIIVDRRDCGLCLGCRLASICSSTERPVTALLLLHKRLKSYHLSLSLPHSRHQQFGHSRKAPLPIQSAMSQSARGTPKTVTIVLPVHEPATGDKLAADTTPYPSILSL